ncbi:MAG TPA: tRNA (adenosine(37)-N6)-threonylcarbamoyltransferase complex ATPase subunit type 1 TsaE [Candidatus Udaeobacter sp.]|nr:tRNA (adenosine(37)-N6)-threonylcarbamoyltransferase complex ATPase subunit type 1 TsaE [Candidatus Udaeobacter sp.]
MTATSRAPEEAARIVTSSPEATAALGEALADSLEVADVLVLEGPLGAGKTRFVEGLARGIAAAARVRSPTFTLVNEYSGRKTLLHVDLYRVEGRAAEGLGLDELIERGVLAVEWGEKLPSRFRAEALSLRFEVLSPLERRITARASAGRGLALLAAWKAQAAK